jgi:parvulin-like peptidyl-prolyl isomerase
MKLASDCWIGRLLIVVVLLLSARADADDAQQAVAATVDGRPIYAAQVERLIERTLGGRPPLEGFALVQMKARTLEQLVSRQLILSYLQTNGQAASKDDIDLELARIEKQLKQQGLSLDDYLQQSKLLDVDDLRGTLAWQLSWQRFLEPLMTEENLKKHFDRTHAHFDGTQLDVAHIRLPVEPRDDPQALQRTLDKAAALREEIVSGKVSFADAAKQHSVSPTAEDGGKLGRISRHSPQPEPYSATAFALKKGEISPPVVTAAGVHLIQCLEVHPGQKPFEAVRDEVQNDARRFLFEWVVERQRGNSKIEYTGASPYYKPGTAEIVGQ